MTQALLAQAEQTLAAHDALPLPVGNLAAILLGTLAAIGSGDVWMPGPRERAGALLRGLPEDRLARLWGGAKPYRIPPVGTSPALRALEAVGLAAADPKRLVVVHLGVGSAADGAFSEALNLAALTKAPVCFVVAVPTLGDGAPIGVQLQSSPSALAAAFGLGAVIVDGREASEVQAAVQAAKASLIPTVIEARLSAPDRGET